MVPIAPRNGDPARAEGDRPLVAVTQNGMQHKHRTAPLSLAGTQSIFSDRDGEGDRREIYKVRERRRRQNSFCESDASRVAYLSLSPKNTHCSLDVHLNLNSDGFGCRKTCLRFCLSFQVKVKLKLKQKLVNSLSHTHIVVKIEPDKIASASLYFTLAYASCARNK